MHNKIVMLLLIVLPLFAFSVQEVELKDATIHEISSKDVTIEAVSYTGAYMSFVSSKDRIIDRIKDYINIFFEQKLIPSGPLMGVFPKKPNSPDETIPLEIGFPVNDGTAVTDPLKLKTYSYEQAAIYVHVGDYLEIFVVYDSLVKLLTEAGYNVQGTTILRYLDNPEQVPAEDVRTEIVIPLD